MSHLPSPHVRRRLPRNEDGELVTLGESGRPFFHPLAQGSRLGAVVLRLPEPMLARSGPIPFGHGWTFEPSSTGSAALSAPTLASAPAPGVAGT
jgi:hypothetical protein